MKLASSLKLVSSGSVLFRFMEKLAGPVSGKNGAVLLYQATGMEMLEQRLRPMSLVLLKISILQIPV